MKSLSIQKRIALAFAGIVLIACTLTVYAFSRLNAIQQQASSLAANYLPGERHWSRLGSLAQEHFNLVQNHLLTANAETRSRLEPPIQIGTTNLAQQFAQLNRRLTSSEDRRLAETLNAALADYLRLSSELRARAPAAKAQENPDALAQRLQPAFQRTLAAIHTLDEASSARGLHAAGEIQPAVAATKLGLLAGLTVSLVVVLLGGFLLGRAIDQPLTALVEAMERIKQGDFTGRLALRRSDEFGQLAAGFNQMAESLSVLVSEVQKSGQQVNNSTSQIATTARQQQQTAREIAETTLQVGITSKQISATSQELVTTIQELTLVAEHTSSLADNGQTGLLRMQTTIQQIMEASSSIAAKLSVLNEKASKISAVVTTINKVADQTNLLSLNAAIEAEKAGEYGLGFSVVATEIRRLADQTAVATNDIEKMVQEMQAAVTAGVMGMDKFADAVRTGVGDVNQVGIQLGQIIEQVQVLTPRFEAVNGGMKHQASGAQVISDALVQLSDSARQTAESLKQSSEVIEQLNSAATGLQQGVSRFKFAT